jgi:hypothetical protein
LPKLEEKPANELPETAGGLPVYLTRAPVSTSSVQTPDRPPERQTEPQTQAVVEDANRLRIVDLPPQASE